jgi:hypothetical protein
MIAMAGMKESEEDFLHRTEKVQNQKFPSLLWKLRELGEGMSFECGGSEHSVSLADRSENGSP